MNPFFEFDSEEGRDRRMRREAEEGEKTIYDVVLIKLISFFFSFASSSRTNFADIQPS